MCEAAGAVAPNHQAMPPTRDEGGVSIMALRVIWPLLLTLGAALGEGLASAQEPVPTTTHSKFAVFQIPFKTDAPQRLKQIQLYVSTDKGQTWRQASVVTPDRKAFDYTAQADGVYWFAVRTVDIDNRAFPLTMEGARPGLIVNVDTTPPVARLRALPPREGEVGVEWEVRDDNLLPGGVRLEYHLAGSTSWVPLAEDLPPNGQRYWKPSANGPVEVQLHAEDRAGNKGIDKTTVVPSLGTAGAVATAPESAPVRHPDGNVRLVNSKWIALHYEIKDKGPSGVSAIELWYTRDAQGRSWSKYREEDGKTPPPFKFEVDGEGLYGFTLVVRSGVGLSDRPPQVGDQPQVWVEVDLTKPVVRLGAVDVGRGTDTGRLTIHWTATDKNFGPQPITLSYANQAGGPWTPIAANIENSGRYVWKMPADVPYQFLVRVEATDRAGNVGSDETSKLVSVDLALPKSVILNVEPAGK
jgi:hypothetical protein